MRNELHPAGPHLELSRGSGNSLACVGLGLDHGSQLGALGLEPVLMG